MAETAFNLAYDGPALETGRMPVRDLAPALLAVGDLFALASGVLYPDLQPVAVKVEATADGSFLVRLLLDADDAWEQLVDIFGSADASALTNLRDTILTVGGLFWLIKKVGRRRVTAADSDPDPGTVRLTLDDTTTLDVPSETWALYRHVEIRKYSREVVEPLGREGVEVVRFTAEHEEVVAVEKEDLPAFTRIEDEGEALLEDEQTMWVEIVAVAFKSDNKWRLSLGDYTFWATMDDADFLARVDAGIERFGKGDMLRCRVEIKQTRNIEGLHTEHRIIQVLEHRPRATQLMLDE